MSEVRKANTVMGLLLLVVVLASCASMMLSPDASQQEKLAAMCRDAQFGYTLSIAMLDKQLTASESQYWQAYKVAAIVSLQQYCMGGIP